MSVRIEPTAREAPDHEAPDHEAMATMAFVLALRARGVRDLAVLGAMERVPRDRFAPRRLADLARTDVALPLPCGQTMTAPSTVATMLAALNMAPGGTVLEVGTGSGYATALLAQMGGAVTSLERFATLAAEASARLAVVGIDPERARVRVADGCAPSPAELPGATTFDRILVNGVLPALPPALIARLAPGGRLVGALAGGEGRAAPRLAIVECGADGTFASRLEGPLRLSPLLSGRAAAL